MSYAKVGRWRDYLTGEKAYMVMSLVAKSLLAWQVVGNAASDVTSARRMRQ